MNFIKFGDNKYFLDYDNRTVLDCKLQTLGLKQVTKLGFKNSEEAFLFLEKLSESRKSKTEYCDLKDIHELIRQNLEYANSTHLPYKLPDDILVGVNWARVSLKDFSAILKVLDQVRSKHKLSYKKVQIMMDTKHLRKKKLLQEPYITIEKTKVKVIPFLMPLLFKE